jgi:hypothetical protein
MVPSAAIARGTRTWIRNQLANNIQNPESFNNDYVRYQDIQKAWSGNDTLQRVFQASLTPVQVKLITEELLRFLSILVFIRADDFLDGFPGSFFDEAGHLLYKDSDLPLRDNQVPPFEDLALRRDFFNAQFLFKPVRQSTLPSRACNTHKKCRSRCSSRRQYRLLKTSVDFLSK